MSVHTRKKTRQREVLLIEEVICNDKLERHSIHHELKIWFPMNLFPCSISMFASPYGRKCIVQCTNQNRGNFRDVRRTAFSL